jgi:hypothetical protein
MVKPTFQSCDQFSASPYTGILGVQYGINPPRACRQGFPSGAAFGTVWPEVITWHYGRSMVDSYCLRALRAKVTDLEEAFMSEFIGV